MSFLSPPKPPSPQEQANAQMRVNRDMAGLQAAYMRPDQYDPFGGTEKWDETGKDSRGNPLFSKTVSLGETGQQYAQGLSGLGQQYFQGANDLLNNQPNFGSNEAFDRAYGYASANLEPRFERSREAMESRLRNQGLDPTSEAYRTSMNDQALQQNEARNSLVTGLQRQLHGQGLQEDNQNINRLSALTQPGVNLANQVLNPGVGPVQAISTGTTPNMAAISQANFQNEMNNYAGLTGGIGNLAGLGLKAFGGGLF